VVTDTDRRLIESWLNLGRLIAPKTRRRKSTPSG
jgi:hypothetical protein